MSTPGIKERLDNPSEQQRSAIENELTNARFAMPGIIVSFDAARQTASVQPAITENVQIGDSNREAMNLPVLSDVPVQFPRAGGYCLTFPVKKDDECLLVFGDMCIDGWWQSGGVQDQMEKRRHDLSDAIAILGITSVPRAVKSFSTSSVMLRNEEGSTYVEISGADVNVVAGGDLSLTCGGTLTIKGATVNIN